MAKLTRKFLPGVLQLNSIIKVFSHPQHHQFISSKDCIQTVRNCRLSSNLMNMDSSGMQLRDVVGVLEKFAPPQLAESWDNTGLLVEPSQPHVVKNLFLTNDLTEEVLDEAIEHKSDMILSYHPPIFTGLKRLVGSKWKDRIVVKAIENQIAIYSPHTSFDSVKDGVNDWLISCFDGKVSPIQPKSGAKPGYLVTVKTSDIDASVFDDLKKNSFFTRTDGDLIHMRYNSLSRLSGLDGSGDLLPQVIKLEKLPLADTGVGRICTLDQKITIQDAVDRVKNHLSLPFVRIALKARGNLTDQICSVAVCAGSGSSVLGGVEADLYLTGEMSHHDVLDATSNGRTVILCEHSNTERGYLKTLAPRLTSALHNVRVVVSETDRDPLVVI